MLEIIITEDTGIQKKINVEEIENIEPYIDQDFSSIIIFKNGFALFVKEDYKEISSKILSLAKKKVGKCKDCQDTVNLIELTKDLIKNGRNFIDCLIGTQAEQDMIKKRKFACHQCPLVDSKGERLYRTFGKLHTCGDIRYRNLLRISGDDGCGCILELKWKGYGQKCPNKLW